MGPLGPLEFTPGSLLSRRACPYPEDVLNLFTSNDTQIEITEDDIDFGKEDIDLEDLSDVDDDDI